MATTHTRGRRRAERAAMDAALLEAATRADECAVKAALARGADVNAADDATENTAVTCAIAGDSSWEDVDVSDASFMLESRVRVLKMLLRSETASLYALNAPARGVTPLGLAAWLNVPEAVRVLLEESRGLVAVDGTDSLGVTPLMYTARDGAVEAASILLANGARPDLRNTHHRTAIHHALRHPRMLWLCESSLRKQRLREYTDGNRRQLHPIPQPHAVYAHSHTSFSFDLSHWPAPSEAILSRSTAALIRAVTTHDLPAIYQVLFPASHRTTVLVNRLDSQGWAPLHYCVSSQTPSVEVLDALFLAGADTSLYTNSRHGTPLHCLAWKAQDPVGSLNAVRLHNFIYHLVRELRAPLAATDEDGETCLHVAAEHGQSIEALIALLACDIQNTVREMKNSRGLTPLEVARPELRGAFGPEAEPQRSSSVASFRTIRPSTSSSTSTWTTATSMNPSPRPQLGSGPRPEPMIDDVELSSFPRRILDNLATVAQEAPSAGAVELSGLREVLDDTSHLGEMWVHGMHSRIHEAASDLRDARSKFNDVDNLLETVTRELEEVFGFDVSDQRDSTERARRRTTDSGDSDSTAVSSRASSNLSRKWRSMSDLRASSLDDNAREHSPGLPELPYLAVEEEGGSATPVDKSASERSFLNALLSPTTKDLLHKSSKLSIDSGRTVSPASHKKDVPASGTSKLKAWFRKKLRFEIQDSSSHVRIVLPGEQSPRSRPHSPSPRHPTGELLDVSRQIIRTAGRDLSCIEGCMDDADEFLSLAANLLSQAERRLKVSIISRQAALESARLAQLQDRLDDPFMSAIASTIRAAHPDGAIPFPRVSRPRSDSDSSTGSSLKSSSAGSSMVSLSSTLIEAEDDDTRVLRRLLTRKVQARTDGALEEIDKALTWLRIVQDTLRTLRRRAQASTAANGTAP